ncbi:hypothetical protein FJTKL_03299 [Diaporthe vaccinii]|uniref:DNA-directed RNA polymerase I subunit n=1 Tax=Diaporthe vaccinii TaxID=105482 RepID=A0ABR4DVX0_9PEZI
MAGARAPSGSLRNHASTASKASRGGVFGTQPSAPKLKPSTFVGSDDSDSDSDSDSSSSSSDSDGSEKKQVKQTPLPKQKADVAKATPAKSPTVNGLKASIKKEQPSKKIKKEATSSSESSGSGSGSGSESDSESDSASSSDEKPTKAPAKGEEVEKSTKPKPETKTAAADDSDSSSASESTDEKAKRPATKADKKKEAPPKSKAKAVKQVTPSESESQSESSSQGSSAESESESESHSGSESEEDSEGSEDPEAQIQQQIRDDVKSAKATKAREPIPSSKAEVSNKKIKTPNPSAPKDDGDIEMTDPSTALTNGGAPTKVGSVPEFVAPDFHLRKVDGSIGASEVAGFFEKAKMEGKQVWYITAPASLPVTVVQDLTIPMDSAHKGLPVLTHNGDDYRLAFDDPSAASSFRLLIPNKKGQEYSELGRPVDQTMHFTRSETFLPEGPASVTTTQTVSKTTRPARPQPEGLRARYTPLGVPASKKPLAPIAGSEDNPVTNVTAQEATAISTPKSSSKKKRKHDETENHQRP